MKNRTGQRPLQRILEDEDKFLEARGFVPKEVKKMVHNIVDTRKNILKDVLEEQSAKLEKKYNKATKIKA